MNYRYFTSESVCSGHPDKICDQISDAILDTCFLEDRFSRVAVETLATTNLVIIAGEVSTKTKVDFEKVARKIIKNLGYDQDLYQFNYKNVEIKTYVHRQSEDIAYGVDKMGAGDQGMMFGFACDQTPELMPLPIVLAHAITKGLDEARLKKLKYLRPDGKSQVTVEYQDGTPIKVAKVITAVPHDPKVKHTKVTKDVFEIVIKPQLAKYGLKIDFANTVTNGTGKWEVGGPSQDTGLTGRKIMVDTYGAYARVGGGCFSGKDPTKVDRSGAYAARFLAKNVVARGFAKKCEVQIAYVIGRKQPVSTSIETFDTASKNPKEIQAYVNGLLDLSPKSIIEGLNLRHPIYLQTATYGHFGRKNFPWEKVTKG